MKHTLILLAFLCCQTLLAQRFFEGFNKVLPDEWKFENCQINNANFSEGTGSLEFIEDKAKATSPKIRSADKLTFKILVGTDKEGNLPNFENKEGKISDHHCSLSIFVLEDDGSEVPIRREILLIDTFRPDWNTIEVDLTKFRAFQIQFVLNCDAKEKTHSIFIDEFNLEAFSPLPVELFDFKAIKNTLTFRTASEKNNAFFVIERSTDAKNFQEIGRLKGAGTSTSAKIYQYIDQEQLVGANYYRLKQLDNDGRFEYSKILVTYLNKKAIKANLITTEDSNLKLRIISDENTDALLSIVDMNGKIFSSENILLDKNIETDFLLNANLQKGMYVVQILTSNHQQTSKIFYIN
jgi:hypothetical protein